MVLILPFPDSRLLPNKRLYYMELYRARNAAKQVAGWEAKAWLSQFRQRTGIPFVPITHCTIKYTWYPPDNRRRDEDNYVAAMKPYLDGLVAAGLLLDDSKEVIKNSFREFGPPDKNNPRTEVEITRLNVGNKERD